METADTVINQIDNAEEIPTTKTVELSDKQKDQIQGLRDAADFMEAHPELSFSFSSQTILHVFDAESLPTVVRALGSFEKEFTEYYMNLTRKFGPVKVQAFCSRESVCKKVQVGTKTVTKRIIDPNAPKVELPMIEVEEEEAVYEYQCPPSLLALGKEGAVS